MSEKYFSNNDMVMITNILTYSDGLIILDKNYADSIETIHSQKNASHYINAYYNTNNLTSSQNQTIINNYNEVNPYYKALQNKYGIEPAIARLSKHNTILKSTNNTLNKDEEYLYMNCYYESLEYYNKVLSTKAFENHPNFSNFIKVFLIWSTIQKYLSRTLNYFFNIDLYDLRTLKNAFISQGLDYFDNLPLNYQKRLLKNINRLISNKGNDQCFIDILSIFGLDNIKVYKYVLAKRYINVDNKMTPILDFYKVESGSNIDFINNESISYDKFVSDDKYWMATKEEVLNKEFNISNTKYISIESSLDFNKDVLKLSYFINFLEKLVNDKNHESLIFFNKDISENKINLYDAFICLTSLCLKLYGYKDNILHNPDVINYIYGYTDKDNSIEINMLLKEILYELDKDKNMNEDTKKKLFNFIGKEFKIQKLNNMEYGINDFLTIFNSNESMREKLILYIENTNNYQLYRKLNTLHDIEMQTKININVFDGNKTYSEYLLTRNEDLYNYSQLKDNYSTDGDRFNDCKQRIIKLTESISGLINDDVLSDAITHNPFYGVTSHLQYYINTLILLFKSYTIELKDNNMKYTIKNKKDDNVKLFDSINKKINKSIVDVCSVQDSIKIVRNGGIVKDDL